MTSRGPGRLKSAVAAGVLGLVAAGLASFAPATAVRRAAESAPDGIVGIDTAIVRRRDLDTTLLAGGDLVAVKQTNVECEVEDLDRGEEGGGYAGTLILSVVPEGTKVKKGDVLCVLDSAGFNERLRLERIEVENARAAHRRAELTLETARAALREYREGIVAQRMKEAESRIAMLDSDFERQHDYVAWADRMFAKGYFARAPVLSARQELERIGHDRTIVKEESRVFRLFTVPRETRQFESEVEKAQADLGFQAMRLKAHEARLAHLDDQAGKYTIRAPHDGIIVYALEWAWSGRPLQAGCDAFQHEVLFLLPDLSRMEIEVPVHESMGARLRVGMKAEVRITALPGRTFSGNVGSIELLPRIQFKGWEEQMHFYTRVRLDETPAGLLPFMSAEVRFDTGRVADALVIPPEAMTMVDGQRCCYVVGFTGLERRPIAIRNVTTEFLEVTDGLKEGDRVVLDPSPERLRGHG